MRAILMGTILVLAIAAHAAEQSSTRAGDDSVGQSVSDAARAVGQATRDVAREVGHATRDATKAVGHATREAAKETGQAVAEGAKDAKKAVSANTSKDKDDKKVTDNPAGKTR